MSGERKAYEQQCCNSPKAGSTGGAVLDTLLTRLLDKVLTGRAEEQSYEIRLDSIYWRYGKESRSKN